MKKLFILSLITLFPFLIFNQEEPISKKTHYYLKEWINEEGLLEACILEGDSIPPESIPEGFIKVSVEELHAKGYLTGEEELQWLAEKGVFPETVWAGSGRWGCSWAHCWRENGLLQGTGGSLTETPIEEKIRVKNILRKTTARRTSERRSRPQSITGPGRVDVRWPLIQCSKTIMNFYK